MIRTASTTVAASRREGFWDGSLGYTHATITVLTGLTLGLAFHIWVGYRVLLSIPFPVLAAVLLLPLVGLAVAARVAPGNRMVKWITGIPFAMVSTGAVGLIAVVGGVLPGSLIQERLGLESLWGSWPFLFAGYLMMLNLIGSCGRRAWPLTTTNGLYLASHLGLGVALMGGCVSGLTLERRTMVLFRGHPTDVAYDRQEREVRAPFQVTLREFRMESFAPNLVLGTLDVEAKDGMRQTPGTQLLKTGAREELEGYRVEVTRYLPHAAYDGTHWRSVAWKTAAPAADLRVTSPDGSVTQGWVSCGGQETIPSYLPLREHRALFMGKPRPRKFESDIEIDGKRMTIGVNQPAKVQGYDIYQFSYDEAQGAASAYSVVELVRDPGLPIVYVGIFMLLGATVVHLSHGVGGKR